MPRYLVNVTAMVTGSGSTEMYIFADTPEEAKEDAISQAENHQLDIDDYTVDEDSYEVAEIEEI